jgi:hypothetical protein
VAFINPEVIHVSKILTDNEQVWLWVTEPLGPIADNIWIEIA